MDTVTLAIVCTYCYICSTFCKMYIMGKCISGGRLYIFAAVYLALRKLRSIFWLVNL